MIDIYTHITPLKYLEAFEKKVAPEISQQLSRRSLTTLTSLDARLSLLDQFPGMRQILTLSNPPVELVAEPPVAIELARIANEEMAELVNKYPDHFAGAVACLPMNDLEAALRETDRAIKELGLKGVQIYSNILGKPLDSLEFFPLYEKLAHYDLPIWIHPYFQGTGATIKDGKQFTNFQVSSKEGGPAASLDRMAFRITAGTTTAMTYLAFSHVFDKYPKIKFITHHGGSSVPYFAGRIEMEWSGKKTQSEYPKPTLDYFKMFYADSALHGNVSAMMCAYDFFGGDHLLFGTDMPFGPEMGTWSIRKTIESIEQMTIPKDAKEKILAVNAQELLHLSVH